MICYNWEDPHKTLNPNICLLCMKSGESTNHLFLHYLWLWVYGRDYSNWLIWTGFFLGVYVIWWPSYIKGHEIPLETKFCGKLLVLLWYGLCGGKETLGFFKDKMRTLKAFWDIIDLFDFGPLVSQLLRVLPLMWFNLIGCWCVIPMVWASKDCLIFVYSHMGCDISHMYRFTLSLEVPTYFVCSFPLFFLGFLILPFYLFLLILIYHIVVFQKEKKKKGKRFFLLYGHLLLNPWWFKELSAT